MDARWEDWHRRLAASAAWALRVQDAATVVLPSPCAAWAADDGRPPFVDESGDQRDTDGPLLAALNGFLPAAPQGTAGDVRLWTGAEVEEVITTGWNSLETSGGAMSSGAALLGDWIDQPSDRPTVGMEVWGERELCALHGLWWRARLHRGTRRTCSVPIAGGAPCTDQSTTEKYLIRGHSACRWLIENLQPDNATHLPWAVHVFAMVANDGPWGTGLGADAEMYAQTLLHNAMVSRGSRTPTGRKSEGGDRRAGYILLHAARELKSW